MTKQNMRIIAHDLRKIQSSLKSIVQILEGDDETEEIAEEVEHAKRNIGHAAVALEQMLKLPGKTQ